MSSVNRNKRSITLNLKSTAGRDLARQLATRCHVLVENFTVGQMASFGLGYDDLRPINPGSGILQHHRLWPDRPLPRPPRL